MHVFVENLITVSSSDLMASSNSPNEWRSVIVMVVVVWSSDVYPTVFLEFDQATPGIGAGVTEWVELRRSDHVVGLNVELSFGVSGFAVILFVTALLTSPFHPPDNLRSPTLRRALSVPCQDLVRHPAINVTTFPPSNQMTVIGHVNVWNASTWAQFHVFVIIWPHCFVCFFTTSSYKYSTCTWPKQGAYVCAKSDGSKKQNIRVHQEFTNDARSTRNQLLGLIRAYLMNLRGLQLLPITTSVHTVLTERWWCVSSCQLHLCDCWLEMLRLWTLGCYKIDKQTYSTSSDDLFCMYYTPLEHPSQGN